MVIARVKGMAIRFISDVEFSIFSYSLVFLNAKYSFKFHINNLICLKAKNNIPKTENIISA